MQRNMFHLGMDQLWNSAPISIPMFKSNNLADTDVFCCGCSFVGVIMYSAFSARETKKMLIEVF